MTRLWLCALWLAALAISGCGHSTTGAGAPAAVTVEPDSGVYETTEPLGDQDLTAIAPKAR